MDLYRLSFLSIFVFIACLVFTNSDEENKEDTSLFDFVAYSVLEDFVDVVEVTAWMTRKVKNHIDKLLDEAFIILTKPQAMLKPVITLAENYNRKDCSEGQYNNVTDAVFREFFNINLNCPLIGNKMSLFFNEIHNITSRVADIHRRYINSARNCGPPVYTIPNRRCLQNLVDSCREETNVIRQFIQVLLRDIESFLDAQEEETFQCLINSLKKVRSAAVSAVNNIYGCLDLKGYDVNEKYNSEFVNRSMGLVGNQFNFVLEKLEVKTLPPEEKEVGVQELKFELPKQPYYKPETNHLKPEQLTSQKLQKFNSRNQLQPTLDLEHSKSNHVNDELTKTSPMWRIDPSIRPKYAKKDSNEYGLFNFDPSVFKLNNEFSDYNEENQKEL